MRGVRAEREFPRWALLAPENSGPFVRVLLSRTACTDFRRGIALFSLFGLRALGRRFSTSFLGLSFAVRVVTVSFSRFGGGFRGFFGAFGGIGSPSQALSEGLLGLLPLITILGGLFPVPVGWYKDRGPNRVMSHNSHKCNRYRVIL